MEKNESCGHKFSCVLYLEGIGQLGLYHRCGMWKPQTREGIHWQAGLGHSRKEGFLKTTGWRTNRDEEAARGVP